MTAERRYDAARLPYLDRTDLPEGSQDLLERPISLFRAFAHNPEVLRWMRDIGRWIHYETTLDTRLRELTILQVGYTVRSEYEFWHHVAIGLDFGVTPRPQRSHRSGPRDTVL